jgi:hypothetical protein
MSFTDALKSVLHGHDLRSIELEFRVGFKTSAGFVSSIPKLAWTSAKDKLSGGVDTITVDKYIKSRSDESSRHVTTATESYMEHKKKIAKDVVSPGGAFSIRGAIALEAREPAVKPPNSFVMQRTKHRTSFVKGPWRIDFTRVEIIPIKNDIEEVYELEVELADIGYFFEKEIDLVIEEGRNIAHKLMA